MKMRKIDTDLIYISMSSRVESEWGKSVRKFGRYRTQRLGFSDKIRIGNSAIWQRSFEGNSSEINGEAIVREIFGAKYVIACIHKKESNNEKE